MIIASRDQDVDGPTFCLSLSFTHSLSSLESTVAQTHGQFGRGSRVVAVAGVGGVA